MKVEIKNDFLIVKTDKEIKESYLRKSKDCYKAYWHFIRDLSEGYGGEFVLTDEVKKILKDKVSAIKGIRKIITGDIKPDVEKYAEYFADDYSQYEFQVRAVRFIDLQKKVLLADDVGLGKTIIALSIILHLIETKNLMKFLVVVPASLRLQWLSESRKFINTKMFPDLELIVNNKSKKERHYIYKKFKESDSPTILISSYDLIRRDKDKLKDFFADMIILDEATKIKTRTTVINKAMRNLFTEIEYKLAMTATPIENGLEDLYCICEFLDKRKLYTKTYFQNRYCIMKRQRLWHRNIDIWKITGYRNIKDVKEKLAGMYIRRTVADVELELPDVIKQNIMLELTAEQAKMYKEIVGEIYGDMTREDVLAQLVYLQEVCDSTELMDKKTKSSSKIDEIKRLIDEDLKYSKVVFITRFKKFANILKRELKKQNPLIITGDTSMEERDETINDFNANDDSNILIGTEAIQEGLNLQVANILVNIDLPWNPAKLQQRLGRLRRVGSGHKTIRMINLITEDTIEQRILDSLYEKGILFERMFKKDEAVKIGSLLGMSKKDLVKMV